LILFKALEEGANLTMPVVRQMAGYPGLKELRVRNSRGIVRVFYGQLQGHCRSGSPSWLLEGRDRDHRHEGYGHRPARLSSDSGREPRHALQAYEEGCLAISTIDRNLLLGSAARPALVIRVLESFLS
jgi:hypothetical protein